MKTTALLCGLLGLVTVGWGNTRRGGFERNVPRVILYEDADFRGGSLVLYPGDRIPNLNQARFSNGKRVNDQISSVRIEGGASILLYDHYDFNGQVVRATTDIRNLAHRGMPDLALAWNDRISSVRVTGETPRRVVAVISPDPVIRRAYQEVLGRSADPDGLAYYRELMTDQGWTDQMVRRHMQRSAEFTDGMIQRAYRELFGREPDASGYATYRRLINERNWSEQDLRAALRASHEYRSKVYAKADY
ncbi:MAG: DUF4214 domain-containing protein [Cephaloticoccus sp.]|nr:DUF4214 domain-containing protein [Cephaloticoccus sp.]MCF7760861.1 DUF4214 domain-containing protein [Cephaloticoccus sp.]